MKSRDWYSAVRMSRRSAITALAFSAGSVAQPSSETMTDCVDAHVHVWTTPNRKYPRNPKYSGPEYQPASFTPEDLLGHARPCGVARVLLIQMSFYGFDNTYMLDAIRQYPDVFRGIAVIDDSKPRPQDEMLRLARQGVRGFRIAPGSKSGSWLTTAGMESMWRCSSESGLVLGLLIGPDALASVDAMCARFPDAVVAIDHMARTGSDGQFRDSDVRALCKLARHPKVHIKVSAFYALGRKQPPYDDLAPLIRALYDAYGPKRLMWASDSPFQVLPPHTYRSSIDLVRSRLSFLNDEDRKWILRETAAKLFFTPREGG